MVAPRQHRDPIALAPVTGVSIGAPFDAVTLDATARPTSGRGVAAARSSLHGGVEEAPMMTRRPPHLPRSSDAPYGCLVLLALCSLLMLGRSAIACECDQWRKGTPEYMACVRQHEQDRTAVRPVAMNVRPGDHGAADPARPRTLSRAEQIIEDARQAARDAGQVPMDER